VLALGRGADRRSPSGGPYGPRPQTFPRPRVRRASLLRVARWANWRTGNTVDNPPRSRRRSRARRRATRSSARRHVSHRRPSVQPGITLQPHGDEQPVIKARRWRRNGRRRATGSGAPRGRGCFRPSRPTGGGATVRAQDALYRFNNDMVFVDGQPLKAAGWSEHDAQSYYTITRRATSTSASTSEPARGDHGVRHALLRTTARVHDKDSDRRGPTIRGLTFTQYAFRAIEIEGRDPTACRRNRHTARMSSEHARARDDSRIAPAWRRICAATTSPFGIAGQRHEHRGDFHPQLVGCAARKNVFTPTTSSRSLGYYPAAVKVFNQCHRVK